MTIKERSSEQTDEDGSAVMNALNIALKYGLTVEVVLMALYEAQENPEISISKIMQGALEDWDISE